MVLVTLLCVDPLSDTAYPTIFKIPLFPQIFKRRLKTFLFAQHYNIDAMQRQKF